MGSDSESKHESILRYWDEIAEGLTCQKVKWRPLFGDVTSRYQEPQRHYHTLAHLEEVLGYLAHWSRPTDQPLLFLAAFYHDAVYNCTQPNPSNEVESANLAVESLRGWLLPEQLHRIYELILATTHEMEPADEMMAMLQDADLGPLAVEPERFAQYCLAIRREYALVPLELYCRGRIALLEGVLARPRLYYTEQAYRAWEVAARTNLGEEIGRLHQLLQQVSWQGSP